MGTDDRIELLRFIERLEEFVALNADCTARQVISFLVVALNPGINVTQLSKRTGTTLTSASRHCRTFGFEQMGEKCLVVSGYSDGRSKSLLITDNGMRLLASRPTGLKSSANMTSVYGRWRHTACVCR